MLSLETRKLDLEQAMDLVLHLFSYSAFWQRSNVKQKQKIPLYSNTRICTTFPYKMLFIILENNELHMKRLE